MFEKDCFHKYQPDAVFAGGIAQVRQVIEACHQHNREYSPHTWTNGIGFYINWNLLLSDPDNDLPLEYPFEPPSWIPEFREGIIDPIIPDKNGYLQPFTRPGLGFEINPKMLRKYGKRFLSGNRFELKVIREGLKTALELKRRRTTIKSIRNEKKSGLAFSPCSIFYQYPEVSPDGKWSPVHSNMAENHCDELLLPWYRASMVS